MRHRIRNDSNPTIPGSLNVVRDFDPLAVGGDPGQYAFECAAQEEPSLNDDFQYPFNVRTDVEGGDQYFYRLTWTNVDQSDWPTNLDVGYRFAVDIDEVVYLELPLDSFPAQVTMDNEPAFSFEPSGLSGLLSSSSKQVWAWENQKLYLKLTSDLLAVPTQPLKDGTECLVRIR